MSVFATEHLIAQNFTSLTSFPEKLHVFQPLLRPNPVYLMSLVFGSAASRRSSEISRNVKAGRLRKLAAKIYTDDLKAPAEDIILRHRFEIAAHFYPGAVISHRSVLESGLAGSHGRLHLSVPSPTTPVRSLPGLEIRVWPGPDPQPEDTRTVFDNDYPLFTACQARAVLENLQIARARGNDEPKTLPRDALEAWIERNIRLLGGLPWLEQLHAQAAILSARFGWMREQTALDKLVAAFKGAPAAPRLHSDVARARATGKPYDPERLDLFRNLHARLAAEDFRILPAPPESEGGNRAFWEAYFSNFIEGTKFTVEEAQVLVFDPEASRRLEASRPEDAHDVKETHRLIADPNISREVAADAPHFIELLKRRHARMMASRLSILPGVFKQQGNSFGTRTFVAPDLVAETLARAWPMSQALPAGPHRALFMLFLIAEVHPFQDGNGRISRLAMNAELASADCARLILPTAFRSDYLSVLEALTTNRNPEPYVAFCHKLIELNSRMIFTTFTAAHQHFRQTGALNDTLNNFGLLPLLEGKSATTGRS